MQQNVQITAAESSVVQNNVVSKNEISSQRLLKLPITTTNSVLTNTIQPDISTSMNQIRELRYKVIVFGDSYTGKTPLVRRYVYNSFPEQCRKTVVFFNLNSCVFISILQIGSDLLFKTVKYNDNTIIRLQLWVR